MFTLGLSRYALAIGAASALLAACGGSQGQGVGASGVTPETVPSASRRAHQASGSNGELVYVVTDKAVLMASYPDGQIVGSIPFYSLAGNVCSDPRNGNVFIPEGYAIYEYAHGGTVPIATLSVPNGYDAQGGCSVDPMTGNLAQMAGEGFLSTRKRRVLQRPIPTRTRALRIRPMMIRGTFSSEPILAKASLRARN